MTIPNEPDTITLEVVEHLVHTLEVPRAVYESTHPDELESIIANVTSGAPQRGWLLSETQVHYRESEQVEG